MHTQLDLHKLSSAHMCIHTSLPLAQVELCACLPALCFCSPVANRPWPDSGPWLGEPLLYKIGSTIFKIFSESCLTLMDFMISTQRCNYLGSIIEVAMLFNHCFYLGQFSVSECILLHIDFLIFSLDFIQFCLSKSAPPPKKINSFYNLSPCFPIKQGEKVFRSRRGLEFCPPSLFYVQGF